MTVPRFHVPQLPEEGAALVLPPDALHHARNVLRLRSGAAVRLFDGRGHEVEASVERVLRGNVSVRAGAMLTSGVEPRLHIVLALAPLKGELLSLVVQKSTELGVSEIRPVVTARTERKDVLAVREARRERLARIAAAAAAQCGRTRVPEILPAVDLEALLASPFEGPRLIFCERGGDWPPACARAEPAQALLLVGPTGGWEQDEIAQARAAGFAEITLGPRVLRAETAALAAVTAAQLLWGDFGNRPDTGTAPSR